MFRVREEAQRRFLYVFFAGKTVIGRKRKKKKSDARKEKKKK